MKLVKVVIGTIVFVIPATVTLIDNVGYVAKVKGASMQPILNPEIKDDKEQVSDFVLLNRWATLGMQFERGQIVSLSSPKNPDQKLIKRIVALNGDLIKTSSYKSQLVRVPHGYCWVEGDHQKRSMDSNYFGPIPIGLLHAKATHIVWPPSRWGKLKIIPDPDRLLTDEEYRDIKLMAIAEID